MKQRILTSNMSCDGDYTDKTLINPFDLILHESYIWVTVTESSLVKKYWKSGKMAGSVSVPTPTGITYAKCNKCIYVANTLGNIYKLKEGTAPQVYVTPGGYLAGITYLCGKLYVAVQSTDVNNNNGMTASTTSVAVSRGFVAIYNGVTQENMLKDADLASAGYQPYGVKGIGDNIYMTWATLNTGPGRQGFGYVSVYSPWNGQIVRIINRSNLSIPYGIVSRDLSDYIKTHKGNKESRIRCKKIKHIQTLNIGNKGTGSISSFENIESNGCDYQYTLDVSTSHGGILVNDGLSGMDMCRKTGNIYYVAANDNGRMGSLGVLYTDKNSLWKEKYDSCSQDDSEIEKSRGRKHKRKHDSESSKSSEEDSFSQSYF